MGGISNKSSLLNNKLSEVVQGLNHQSDLLNRRLGELIEGVANQARITSEKLSHLTVLQNAHLQAQHSQMNSLHAIAQLVPPTQKAEADPVVTAAPPKPVAPKPAAPKPAQTEAPDAFQRPPEHDADSFRKAMQQIPLLLDAKTYNTSHTD